MSLSLAFGLFLLYWLPTWITYGRCLPSRNLRHVAVLNGLGFSPIGFFTLRSLALQEPALRVGSGL